MKHTRIQFVVWGQTLEDIYKEADKQIRQFTGLAEDADLSDLLADIDYDIDCETTRYLTGEIVHHSWSASVTAKIQVRG